MTEPVFEESKEKLTIHGREPEGGLFIGLPPMRLYRCSQGHEMEIRADKFENVILRFSYGEPGRKQITASTNVCPACLCKWLNTLPQLLLVEDIDT